MLSGIALGWVKFDPVISIAMTAVFLLFLGFMIYYMTRVTRPRFRFPKEHSRKPKAFYVDGYDPETGKLAGKGQQPRSPVKAPAAPAAPREAEGAAEREALSRSLREINWLLQQGHITPEAAAAKKDAAIKQHTGGGADAPARGPAPSSTRGGFFSRRGRGAPDEHKH